MQALRPHFADEASFVERVDEVQRAEGYRLVGVFEEAPHALAVGGFRVGHMLAWGRFLYVAQTTGGRLFDLSDAREPREVMRMAENAWFLDGSHQGTTLVLPSADRTQVVVYDASNTITL